jgi:hypothetical protein
MQLSAYAVDWARLEALDYSAGCDESFLKNAEEVKIGGDPHWASDSSIQYPEIGMIFDDIRD